MEIVEMSIKTMLKYTSTFLKWIFISLVIGCIGGCIGAIFHLSVEYVTNIRQQHAWIICFLPIGGLLIVNLYNLCKIDNNVGTNQVISSIRSDGTLRLTMAPLIFISTIITHLFGGSAGREGAALQLGGSIGAKLGKILSLDEKDIHLATIVGMSSVFAALFGTPLTAIFFSMEVISVGIIYYSALIPCMVGAMVAFRISLHFGIAPIEFLISNVSGFSLMLVLKVVVLSTICALMSIVFCMTIHKNEKIMKQIMPNPYKRIFVGGIVIVILTMLLNTTDYNGTGMNIIQSALAGNVIPIAFLLKMIFTAITIGAGFKGGEIIPTFFVGATLGGVIGNMIGMPVGMGAAIGLIALFCGVVNTPIASIFLSIELFGGSGLIYFAIASGVGYVLSGYYGLYSSQKIVYSKLKTEYINTNAK